MPDENTTTDAPATGDAVTTTDVPLGEAGQKALDAMKADLKAARSEAAAAKALRKELDDLRAATATDTEKALTEAEAKGFKDALALSNERILRSEVKALAAGKLANPEMAARLLDLSEFTITDDGDVDAKEITKAIDALLASEPYLAAGQANRAPGVPVGPRVGSPDAGDMNAALRRAAGRA